MRPVWVEVELDAIEHNVRILKAIARQGALFMAVVKADGYGHGAVQVAKASLRAGADRLGVALVEEALELREAGVAGPIHILSEIPPQTPEVEACVALGLVPTVATRGIVEMLSAAATAMKRDVKVHVKIDTGMNRLGITAEPDAAAGFVKAAAALPGIQVEGIFTHFATADAPDVPFRREQLDRFLDVAAAIDSAGVDVPLKHAANSAATISFPESHLDMVRAGIALYGLDPSPALRGVADIRPALSWRARISYIKTVPAGQGVSYGLTYTTDRETRIATVPVGYADGYSRLLSNKAEMLVGGVRVPEIGTICMDQLMLDVSAVQRANTGDDVTLIGQDGTERVRAEELAERIGTINYEVVCMIGKRVPRVYT